MVIFGWRVPVGPRSCFGVLQRKSVFPEVSEVFFQSSVVFLSSECDLWAYLSCKRVFSCREASRSLLRKWMCAYADPSLPVFEKAHLYIIILLKGGSVVDMEQAKSVHLLINTELQEHRYPRAVILTPLYEEVTELIGEEEELTWSIFCRSGFLGSLFEMTDM